MPTLSGLPTAWPKAVNGVFRSACRASRTGEERLCPLPRRPARAGGGAKRASDILSPWVGETEQNIASAFREARDSEAFLVFDEAESLLADRRHAERNWEVSQTNEMLTWMESHPLPFACTTNFGDRLDAATLRRFVFKIALDYLAPGQAVSAFRAYFGIDAPPEIWRWPR